MDITVFDEPDLAAALESYAVSVVELKKWQKLRAEAKDRYTKMLDKAWSKAVEGADFDDPSVFLTLLAKNAELDQYNPVLDQTLTEWAKNKHPLLSVDLLPTPNAGVNFLTIDPLSVDELRQLSDAAMQLHDYINPLISAAFFFDVYSNAANELTLTVSEGKVVMSVDGNSRLVPDLFEALKECMLLDVDASLMVNKEHWG